MKKRFMKSVLTAALAVCMAVSMSACGGAKTEAPEAGASEAAGDVEYKDSFIFSQAADIATLDPADTAAIPTLDVLCGMYDSLVTFDTDMNIIPCLATEWNQDDELTWIFKLREDVTFHNGDAMTSADVVYSIKRVAASAKNSALFSSLADAEAVDDYTVKFTLSAPAPTFLNNLANTSSAILPQKYMEEKGEEIITTAPVGTGAYKFVEWNQGSDVKFEANENYWGGEVPTKEVVMKVIPEPSQRTIALETGEIDAAYGVQSNDIERIEEDPNLTMMMAPALSTAYVCMNFEKPGIDNKLVREAIRVAIDSQSICDSVYYGAAVPDDTIIPFAAFGYQEDAAKIVYDPERAKSLLKEAGYENFSTNIYTADNQQSVEICQIIQAQLKEVGIDCEIQTLEFGTFLEKIGKGEHDLCLMTWSTGTVDADFTYYAQYSSTQYGIYGNMMSPGLFPGLDEALEEARSTSDKEVRMAAYKKVEDIVAENSIYRPLVCRNSVVGTSAKVENFELRANDIYNFNFVKVRK